MTVIDPIALHYDHPTLRQHSTHSYASGLRVHKAVCFDLDLFAASGTAIMLRKPGLLQRVVSIQ